MALHSLIRPSYRRYAFRLVVGCLLLILSTYIGSSQAQRPRPDLLQLQSDDNQWIMPAKNYASTRYSGLDQINTENVKQLQPAWTFSTGVLRGQEAAPLVINHTMYIVTPYPNILYALDLSRAGAPWLGNQKLVRRSWHMLTSPLLTWLLQAGALWIWHVPSLFQAAFESASIHALQHLSFLVSALLFWWALIHGRQGVRGHGAAVLSVFTTSLHSSALGALLTSAVAPWYPTYQGNTALWGVTPVEDQQLAGLIMWVPTSALYLCAGLGLCARWLHASDVRELQQRG
jgi:Cytochrome c oxidase caa3 assembly factor (Caa3_CtaG)